MKCPSELCKQYDFPTPLLLRNHLQERHSTFELVEMIAAEGETIPKSKIRAKIKELEVIEKPLRYQSDFHEDYRVKGMIEVLKQLLE